MPVFREDRAFDKLDATVAVSFVTCPAVNAGRAARRSGVSAEENRKECKEVS